MKIIRHPKKKKLKGCVVALGTFDGVHLGHQKVINTAARYAIRNKVSSLAITFDPHPQQLIVPERGLKLLTTLKEREDLFGELGVDGVVLVRFTQQMRKLSYQQFVKKYLVDLLGVSRVFVGYDYAFGKKRAGGVEQLKALGKKYGFTVAVIPAARIGWQIVKSSKIRELISQGKFNRAVKLLNRPYVITGKVVKGTGEGKVLGFPTANLKTDPHKLIPAHGVYAGRVGEHKAAVNIGSRPTFGVGGSVVEVHLLGYQGNLYGQTIKVELTRRLRDEKQFSDVEKLKKQIKQDVSRL
ncbi:MAG: bifunctional riboflavin kinase/FAD synthetase [bacterium]